MWLAEARPTNGETRERSGQHHRPPTSTDQQTTTAMRTMQQLIKSALDAKMSEILETVPTVKKVHRSHDISEVRPLDLAQFMKDNNIPDDAQFSTMQIEGWGFSSNPDYTPSIWYVAEVPVNEEDREEHINKRFNTGHFKPVHDILTANGYKRKGSMGSAFNEFKDTTPFKMYQAGDFDRLEKYYLLSFSK